jgi:prepilin-type N-terminal cleavage/methylation domain-containing protein
MEFKPTNLNRRSRAFTLVEMMVAVAVGCMVLIGAISIYTFSLTSFTSMANFADLDQKSRHTSDILTRDIRSCVSIASATSSQLALNEPLPDGTTVTTTYTYDQVAGTLTRSQNGISQILLTGIDTLTFAPYARPGPSANYEDFVTASPSTTAKLIGIQWSCSRRLAGPRSESQSVQTAIVELRNQ